MVKLVVKHGDEKQFLFETTTETGNSELIDDITVIYNGRLKINRICSELEELSKYGTLLPPNIIGLTDEQVEELKLVDDWGERCTPSGGWESNKDPIGRRNGKRPGEKMRNLIQKSIDQVKDMISKVIEAGTARLWFSGKELSRSKRLCDYIGKNEKTKIVVKLSAMGRGPPAREPVVTEDERKQMMLHAYRRQEQLKKLEQDDDDEYLDAAWADSGRLKRAFQGLSTDVTWRPK